MKNKREITKCIIIGAIIATSVLTPLAAPLQVQAAVPTGYTSQKAMLDYGVWYKDLVVSMAAYGVNGERVAIMGLKPNTTFNGKTGYIEGLINRPVVNAKAFAKAMGYESKYDKTNKVFYTAGLFSIDLKAQAYRYAENGKEVEDMPAWFGTAVEVEGECFIPIEIAMEVYKAYRVNIDEYDEVNAEYTFGSLDKMYSDNAHLDFNHLTVDGKEIVIGQTKLADIVKLYGDPIDQKVDGDAFYTTFKIGSGRMSIISNKYGWLEGITVDKTPNTKYIGMVLGTTNFNSFNLDTKGELKLTSTEGASSKIYGLGGAGQYTGAHNKCTNINYTKLSTGAANKDAVNRLSISIYSAASSDYYFQ